jgi:hypothetical protein
MHTRTQIRTEQVGVAVTIWTCICEAPGANPRGLSLFSSVSPDKLPYESDIRTHTPGFR